MLLCQTGDNPLVACLGHTAWPEGERVSAFMQYINDFGLQFGYGLIKDGAVVPFNFFYTSNISADRELLTKYPFETSFPAAAWEDIELAYRLDSCGLKIRYNASAVARHHHPMTVNSFARRQHTVGKSAAIFYEKHPELGDFLNVVQLRNESALHDLKLAALTLLARLGERYSLLARPRVFETLMRAHYLRGLREGLDVSGGKRP